jgi:hypothetical protein
MENNPQSSGVGAMEAVDCDDDQNFSGNDSSGDDRM